nr:MAG TPA: hypothetical protein [Caudoviricetes sp.]
MQNVPRYTRPPFYKSRRSKAHSERRRKNNAVRQGDTEMSEAYEICIPSYKRAKTQRTLDYLEKIGAPKEHITLSVQTLDDLNKYREAGVAERVNEIIYREGECVADNRNTLLDHFPAGKKLVLMEDDVDKVQALTIERVTGKKKLRTIETWAELRQVIEKGFSAASLYGTVAFGLNLVTNPFYMQAGCHRIKLCGFGLYGLLNTALRFDRTFTLYDDPEFEARVIKKYGSHPVLDGYTAINTSLKANFTLEGGCHELWSSQSNLRNDMLRLMKAKHGDIFNIDPSKDNCITLKKGKGR